MSDWMGNDKRVGERTHFQANNCSKAGRLVQYKVVGTYVSNVVTSA
jgi:hypothetical protein